MLSIIHQSQASSRPLFINSELDFFSTLCKRLVKSYSKCCLRLLSHNNFHIYYLLMFISIDCICLSFLWDQTECSKILQEEDDGRAKKKLPKCFCYPDHFLWWNAICLTTYVLPNCKSPMASRLVLEAGKNVFYCETLLWCDISKKKAQMATLLLNM